jgi:hypothetical protein
MSSLSSAAAPFRIACVLCVHKTSIVPKQLLSFAIHISNHPSCANTPVDIHKHDADGSSFLASAAAFSHHMVRHDSDHVCLLVCDW